MRLSRLEEYEISPGIRVAAANRVEQRVPLLSLFDHFQSNSVHVAGVSQASSSGCQREPVEAVRGAEVVAFGSGRTNTICGFGPSGFLSGMTTSLCTDARKREAFPSFIATRAELSRSIA